MTERDALSPAVVDCAVVAPDGASLYTAGADRLIRKWSVASRQLVAYFRRHTLPIMGLGLASDGNSLVSGSIDEAIVWSLTEARPQKTVKAAVGGICGFAIEGEKAFSFTTNGLLLQWSEDWEVTRKVKAHKGTVFWGLFRPKEGSLLTGGADGCVREWSGAGLLPQRTWILSGQSDAVTLPLCSTFYKDELFLGTNTAEIVRLDPAGNFVPTYRLSSGDWVAHLEALGDRLYFCSDSGPLSWWDAKRGKGEALPAERFPLVRCLARSQNGNTLVWTDEKGTIVVCLRGDLPPPVEPPPRPDPIVGHAVVKDFSAASEKVLTFVKKKPKENANFFKGVVVEWQKEGECEEMGPDGFFCGNYLAGVRQGFGQLLGPDGISVAGNFIGGRIIGEIWIGDAEKRLIAKGKTPGYYSPLDIEVEHIYSRDFAIECRRHDTQESSPFEFSGFGVMRRADGTVQLGQFSRSQPVSVKLEKDRKGDVIPREKIYRARTVALELDPEGRLKL